MFSPATAGNDNLIGGAGNDTLDGGIGSGNDVLTGGADIDTVTYATAPSAVSVSLLVTTAQNTGGAGTDTITTVENLTGSAFDDTLSGNNATNTLTGGAGNDTLNGRAGLNTMIGGTGNDLYIVNNATDIIVEASNGGTSDVIYAFSDYTLGAGVYAGDDPPAMEGYRDCPGKVQLPRLRRSSSGLISTCQPCA